MQRNLVRALAMIGAIAAITWLSAAPALAQGTGTVAGQVTDAATGRAIAGAQVYLVGRELPSATDDEGRYSIGSVPVGPQTVRVLAIGYVAMQQRVTVTNRQSVTADFSLDRSAIALDEIVVTGTGRAVERRKLSTTLDVINTAEIEEAAATSVDQLLQGRTSGAAIMATSAQPGTGNMISFRGVSSVFGNQTPVIYVDGVRVDNSDDTAAGTGGEESSALADIMVTDIERIEITKGGAASTLYGSDAAAGVIQIFTKKGSPGPAQVTARIEQGVDTPDLKYMFDTGLIFGGECQDPACTTSNPTGPFTGDLVNQGYDGIPGTGDEESGSLLRDNFFRNGHAQLYYLGVQGGTDAVTYSVSGRIQQADGVQVKNDGDFFNLRGGVQAELSRKVNVDFNANYTRSRFSRLFNGSAIADPLTTFEVGDALFFSGAQDCAPGDPTATVGVNCGLKEALDVFLLPDIDETVSRFRFASGIRARPNDWINIRGSVGLDFRTNQQRQFEPIGFVPGEEDGQLNRFDREFVSVSVDAAATFSYPREGTFTNDFTVGIQGFRDDVSTVNALGSIFALPGAPDFDEAAEVSAFETNTEIFSGGIILQDEVGAWDKLFLTAGLRVDANSTFGDDVQAELYPKLGASYILSDESFFEDALGDFVDNFKVRAAWGKTGKFPEPFLRDRSFSAIQFRGEAAPTFDNPGNADLSPEVTATFETGFDLAVWSNRIGLSFTYYNAKTSDALFFVPEQPSTGQDEQLRNVGEITNKGIELEASVQILDRRDVSWGIQGTYSTVDNEVTDLGGVPAFFIAGTGNQYVDEGRAIGSWYANTPFDSDNDGFLDDFELRFTGESPIPTKLGTLATDVILWDRLSVTARADWAAGHQVIDWGSRWATFNGIYRRELIEEGFVFPERANGSKFSQSQARSAFIVDGDFFKVREIGVRYRMPDEFLRMGLDRWTVYGSLRNAWIWSRNKMIDPELNGVRSTENLNLGGISSVTLSPPRQWRFGMEFTF